MRKVRATCWPSSRPAMRKVQAKKSLQTDALKRLALSVVAAGVIVVGAFVLLFLCYCLLKKPESVNPGKEAGGCGVRIGSFRASTTTSKSTSKHGKSKRFCFTSACLDIPQRGLSRELRTAMKWQPVMVVSNLLISHISNFVCSRPRFNTCVRQTSPASPFL